SLPSGYSAGPPRSWSTWPTRSPAAARPEGPGNAAACQAGSLRGSFDRIVVRARIVEGGGSPLAAGSGAPVAGRLFTAAAGLPARPGRRTPRGRLRIGLDVTRRLRSRPVPLLAALRFRHGAPPRSAPRNVFLSIVLAIVASADGPGGGYSAVTGS